MSSTTSHKSYLPAAGHDLFLPLYDPITKLLGIDKARRALIEQAELSPGRRVLEVGCGTGGVLALMKRLQPRVDVVGVDPDPKALARATRKMRRAGLSVRLDRGFAESLEYDDGSFDRVLSSFMFHHLERSQQAKMLAEIRRVLKSGGRFEMVDFAGGDGGGKRGLHRLFHSHERLRGNAEHEVLTLLSNAGFVDARAVAHERTLIGGIVFYQASTPAPEETAA